MRGHWCCSCLRGPIANNHLATRQGNVNASNCNHVASNRKFTLSRNPLIRLEKTVKGNPTQRRRKTNRLPRLEAIRHAAVRAVWRGAGRARAESLAAAPMARQSGGEVAPEDRRVAVHNS
jgi:hypothetical protein